MITSIITLLMGVVVYVMMTQPLFWCYSGQGKDLLNKLYQRTSCYEGIKFQENQDTYYTIGCVFLIIGMVFAGLMLLLTLLNMIGRSSGGKRVGAKFVSLMYFLSMLIATIMFAVFMNKASGDVSIGTVGYGLIVSTVAAFLALIFSPRKKKN